MEDEVRLSDISKSYRDVAEIIGVDAFLKLCKVYGGSSMYLPTERAVLKPLRDKKIKREFNGSNLRSLSLKYGICETHIRKILFEGLNEGRKNKEV